MTAAATDVDGPQREPDRLEWEYYYRDGMNLRAAPRRASAPSWRHLRQTLYRDWLDVGDSWHDTVQTRLLDDHRWQGDQLMDGVVEMFDRVGPARGRELFEQALIADGPGTGELPDELRALVAQIHHMPTWHDPARIERGRRILNDVSVAGKLGAGVFGIFATAISQDVSAATGATGRIVREPIRRAVESHEFFEKITYRGALVPGSEAVRMIVRVRLMHALVRRGLRRQWGDDNFRTHGMPISNTRLAEGSGWFASMPLLVDHVLGRRRPMRDHDDVALYWGYILYLFGVEERLIPLNGYDSLTLANHIFCDAGEASPWRAELVEGLLHPVQAQVPAIARPAIVAIILGAAAAVMGVDTVQAALAGTRYEQANLRQCRRWYFAFARPSIAAAIACDHVPALSRWRSRRTARGDYVLTTLGPAIRSLGRRHGVTDVPFIHHDDSISGTSFGRRPRKAP
ncbi:MULTISPECIES: oxygenase MpaB family protein [unclassified Mycobacterium]|uniref:oxygenase MpaB family protein n=1 Tax=unclassified Mycobacterium TaxID=2642494 RepID=UPI00089AD666|nr:MULTISPECIES: oxygenase MpaB family protein [unclassified Mycobacterium]SEA31140.1 hypothetical protein SAMN04488580_102323 [Mycobacterium sp. 283mftsu]